MRRSLIAVAGLALVLYGCGGGGNVPTINPADTSPGPSKTVVTSPTGQADTDQQANQAPSHEPDGGTALSAKPAGEEKADMPPPPPAFWE